ncbi:MAG: hypothetical protein ABFD44_01585 [Anaerolineaceae bacterium]
MTSKRLFRLPLRFALVGIVLVSLCLTNLAPANAQTMFSLTPLTSFPADSYPAGLVYGPDQSIWFTLSGSGAIGQTTGGTNLNWALPDATVRPLDLTIGSDQALWFSEENGNQIGRITTAGEVTEYSLGAESRKPTAVALGQDLALWFTEFDGNRIGRMTTSGEVEEFPLAEAGSKPLSIVSDAEGNLWFTEWGTYRVGKITLQGEIQEYPIPNPPARPAEILFGPDGNLWVSFNTGKTVARINPQTAEFTFYRLPTQSSTLADLTIGPDGQIWYVGTQTVGSFGVSAAGASPVVTEVDLPTPVYTYRGRSQIIAGPDNDLILTTANTSDISRTVLPGTSLLRNLQIFVTYQPPVLLAAGPFNIDARIVNWTNTAASNVEIDLSLDENIQFVSADIPGGSCAQNNQIVHCTLSSLAGGASLPVSFVMTTDRIHEASVDRSLSIKVVSAEGDYQPANNRVILFTKILRSIDFFYDFSEGADGNWSHQNTSTPVDGLKVLGLFDNDEVSFDVDVLPPHDRVWLCFDLYVMGAWDGSQYMNADETKIIGPDLWVNYVDDQRLLMTTFSNQSQYNQAYPENYPDAVFPSQTRSASVGEYDGDPATRDARYHFCYRLEHADLSLKVLFMGLNLDGLEGEKWAIDNVGIKILYDALFDYIYIPAVLR